MDVDKKAPPSAKYDYINVYFDFFGNIRLSLAFEKSMIVSIRIDTFSLIWNLRRVNFYFLKNFDPLFPNPRSCLVHVLCFGIFQD